MGNRMYFIVLIILIIVLILLRMYFFPGDKFLFVGGGILVFYLWCKKEFAGAGWFEKKKPAVVSKAAHTFDQFTDTINAEPLGVNEKQGYLQLMRELVTPALHPKLEPVIQQLKTFDDSNDAFEPLYSLSNFTDDEDIAFISLLDWKSAIEDLVWRIETSLRQNYDTMIDLPSDTQWEPNASISYDNVFKTYDDALRQHGFQLGFMNTGGDDYALLVFKTAQKERVEEAVKLTGYGYYEISGK